MAASIGEKAIRWVGSSCADLKPFDEARARTREIRLRNMAGSFRVMHVVRFDEAVYVLHCFQKKTQATSSHDKSIIAARHRAVEQARRNPSWP
jgi:phage-related protein